MEENTKEQMGTCEHACQSGWCKKLCCGGGRHIFLRWILGILILVAVFSLGIKVGEFKSLVDGGYGGRFERNRHYGAPMMFYGYAQNEYGDNFGPARMMRGWNNQIPQQTATSTQQ